MKTFKVLFVLALASASLIRCAKHNDASPRDQKISQLTSGIWVPEKVVNSADGDLTSLYADFSISFGKDSQGGFDGFYYLSGGGHAFEEDNGNWKLNQDLTAITLESGKEMEFTLTNNSLTLAFNVVPKNGRVGGLSGRYTFSLKRI